MPVPPPSALRFQWTAAGLSVYSLVATLPGPLGANVGNRVAGILAHRSGQDRLFLMASYSGGLYNPGDDPLVLPNEWVGRVDRIRALLRMSMTHRNDRQGGRFAPGENDHFWHCSHCEKKLAVFGVAVLLREFGYRGDIGDITLPELAAMRSFEWQSTAPDFEIHITRAPCKLCVKFVRLLAAITGVSIKIITSGLIEVYQEFVSQGGEVYEDDVSADDDDLEEGDDQSSDMDEECHRILHEAYQACGLERIQAAGTPGLASGGGGGYDAEDAEEVVDEIMEVDPDEPMPSIEEDDESLPDLEDTPSPSPVPVPPCLHQHIQEHKYSGPALMRPRSVIKKPFPSPIYSPPHHPQTSRSQY